MGKFGEGHGVLRIQPRGSSKASFFVDASGSPHNQTHSRKRPHAREASPSRSPSLFSLALPYARASVINCFCCAVRIGLTARPRSPSASWGSEAYSFQRLISWRAWWDIGDSPHSRVVVILVLRHSRFVVILGRSAALSRASAAGWGRRRRRVDSASSAWRTERQQLSLGRCK